MGPQEFKTISSQQIDMPKLISQNNNAYGIVKQETTIGRHRDNSLVIECASISQHHCKIIIRDGEYMIVDLNSSNGVRVNEKRVPQIILKHNDMIQLGAQFLTFVNPLEKPKKSVSLARTTHSMARTTRDTQYFDQETPFEDVKLVKIKIDAQLYRISAEIEPIEEDFTKLDGTVDIDNLKRDYEKLRLAYQLSKRSFTINTQKHYEHMLDLIFAVLPIDRGVVLEIESQDQLRACMVKIRDNKDEKKEIELSSTILSRVFNSKKCLITVDTSIDPDLGKSQSIVKGNIRSVICLPLIAHNKVLGILHLDSKERVNAFAEKDVSLVRSIANQTAIMIENTMLMKEAQKEVRMTEQLSRFLPPILVKELMLNNNPLDRGGEHKEGTILFIDIRGFTGLSEGLNPSEIFQLLNEFFERMVKIVFDFNGMVDKFIGDCLMCGFGLIEDTIDPELRAINAALAMRRAVYSYNESRYLQGKSPISVGIGLNTGTVFFGVLGSTERVEVTSIGDTVNISSRICDLASNNEILISESTFLKVKHDINAKSLGGKQLKGKQRPVKLYEVTGSRNGSMTTLA